MKHRALSENTEERPDDVKSLPDPGPCLVLVMKTVLGGESSIQYIGDPEWAIDTLRGMADKIETDLESS